MMSSAVRCFLLVVSTISAFGVIDVAWDYLQFGANPKYDPLGNVYIAVFEIVVFMFCGVVCGTIAVSVIGYLTPRTEAPSRSDASAPKGDSPPPTASAR